LLQGETLMKTVKSLILMLVLAGATYAGEILQPAPPPDPAGMTQPTTADKAIEMLISFVPNLLLWR
jgi:hypothetical protein